MPTPEYDKLETVDPETDPRFTPEPESEPVRELDNPPFAEASDERAPCATCGGSGRLTECRRAPVSEERFEADIGPCPDCFSGARGRDSTRFLAGGFRADRRPEHPVSGVFLHGHDPGLEDALNVIADERRRQDRLKEEGRFRFTCADEEMSNCERLACLVEEVGEVAREVLTQKGRRLARDTEGTEEALREEISQVAAICVAWLESPCNSLPRQGW